VTESLEDREEMLDPQFRWLILFLVSCGVAAPSALSATGDSFSFVVIADPHVTGGPSTEKSVHLQQAVDWVNAHRQQHNIKLTFAVGDVAWGAGLPTAKGVLDGLSVPYAPLIGDDEVQAGSELAFNTTFQPDYESLAALSQDPNSGLSNFQKAGAPVWNPEINGWSTFQNFAFDFGGVHFASLDWVPRSTVGYAEDADLHDFAGGTWPWFTDYVANCSKGKTENVVMLAHHPMFTLRGEVGEMLAAFGAFSPQEWEMFDGFLGDPNYNYGDYLYAAYTGHLHSEGFLPQDADPNYISMSRLDFDPNAYDPNGPIQFVPLPGYDLYIVDDTFEDTPRLELVTVTEGETGYSYVSTCITVPEPSTAMVLLAGAVGPGLLRDRRRTRR
jgi:hypothetical protein